MKKFVVFSAPRSGTTWVVDMLNSQPAITAYSELFLDTSNPRVGHWGGELEVSWNSYFEQSELKLKHLFRPYVVYRYLDEVFSSRKAEALGFKLIYRQFLRCPEMLVYMLVNRVSIVHLIRRNFLDNLLSREMLQIRNLYHSHEDVEQVQVRLDTSSILKKLRNNDRQVTWAGRIFSRLGLPYVEVSYEDLLSDEKNFNVISDFLGVEFEQQELSSRLRKLNKGSHREIIANYEEVKKALEGTKYDQLLDRR